MVLNMKNEGAALSFEDKLKRLTKTESVFSLGALKREFPKHKKEIDKYLFIGLIERISFDDNDSVIAYIF